MAPPTNQPPNLTSIRISTPPPNFPFNLEHCPIITLTSSRRLHSLSKRLSDPSLLDLSSSSLHCFPIHNFWSCT
ncbi:hypothetical protein Pyn_36741 [Prunus yedoensis var. nudiflora]|uniref:Uncharacterized protein n=1 Tax=Prunus yedoensis var. nudiflora TaxID=2094558 RepID=A0A314Z7V3_PRUYE|nr:hypothetical protein Pyn_36741 [Prunus yedoensis var. nudiflora]